MKNAIRSILPVLALYILAATACARSLNSTYNVMEFGAVGDGIIDDTAALQLVIDMAKDYSTPGIAYIPTGKYKLTRPLVIDRRVEIVGSGYGTQIFQSRDEHLFSIAPYQPAAAHNMRIRNMTLGSAATTTGKAVVNIDSVSGAVFEDLFIAGGYDGIRLNNSHSNRFVRLTTYSQPNGFFGKCSTNQHWVHAVDRNSNANIFISPNINMGNWGFYWEAGNVLTILGGNIQGGSEVKGAYFYNTDRLHITGLHFESTSVGLILRGCSNTSIQEVGCGAKGLVLDACNGVFVLNGKFNAINADAACKRIYINGTRCPSISVPNGAATILNVQDPRNPYHRPAGILPRSTKNLIPGDVEVWSGGMPVGFSEFGSDQTTARETKRTRFGRYSAKLVVGQKTGRAGLYYENLNYANLAGRQITLSAWVWNETGTGRPYLGVELKHASGKIKRLYASENIPAGEWTRISRTFDVLPNCVSIRAMFCICWYDQGSRGDTCYLDGLEVTEGDCASPMYDNSGDVEQRLRAVESALLKKAQ